MGDPSSELLRAAARNCGEAYAFPSIRMGRPSLMNDFVIGADLGLPVGAPTNSATLLRPPSAREAPSLLAELRSLFSGPGGGWSVWDPWSSVDLGEEGFVRDTVPCMVRDAGGDVPPVPPDLVLVEVTDGRTLDDLNRVVLLGYGLPDFCADAMWTAEVFGDPSYRGWVGYVEGRPVSTASAYRGAGLVGVYVVATIPEARGHGYGEALTWAAVQSSPGLDATLQASDMGRPVYERMGFRTVADYTTWSTDERLAAA